MSLNSLWHENPNDILVYSHFLKATSIVSGGEGQPGGEWREGATRL